jgi:hypothetical protein
MVSATTGPLRQCPYTPHTTSPTTTVMSSTLPPPPLQYVLLSAPHHVLMCMCLQGHTHTMLLCGHTHSGASHHQSHHHCDVIDLAATGAEQTTQKGGLLRASQRTAAAACDKALSGGVLLMCGVRLWAASMAPTTAIRVKATKQFNPL